MMDLFYPARIFFIMTAKEVVMKKNMGSADRIIRFILAAVIVVLILTKYLTGTWAIVLGVLAGVFIITSFISICPLYLPLKISTRKK